MIKILKQIIVIGGLIILFIFGYIIINPSSKRIFKKARSLHKKGEKYYNLGDLELAQDYYSEADILRKKAREMN